MGYNMHRRFLLLLFWLLIPTVAVMGQSDKLSDSVNRLSEYPKQQNTDNNIQLVSQTTKKAEAEKKSKEPISIAWSIPFILLLLSIAIIPLFAPGFWHHNYWKLSLFVFGLPMLIISLLFLGPHVRNNTIHEIQSYITFILLLASLFTISGAIVLRGTLVGTPLLNTIILAIGACLASFMATTGASMLLIRPLIKANQYRQKKVHIVLFFIFTVSNAGGLLTPLGDPPLFLGYLKGVPFTWTMTNLLPEWALVNILLLITFFIWDTKVYRKEVNKGIIKLSAIKKEKKEPLKIQGLTQFIFLGGVILSIYFQGRLAQKYAWWPHFGPQEGAMILMLLLSLLVAGTHSQIRKDNEFSWFPIKEVAALFAGIFACMVPTLYLLELYGKSLPLTEPWHFFWVTGGLSSALDNAPTYIVFLELAKSVQQTDIHGIVQQKHLLAAISCGAVFMGANTYIGNAPNFMVKAIAEEQGIAMPSFFGYILYSASVLIPIYIIVSILFFPPSF